MEKPSLDSAKAGAIRFNTDSSQMEIYDGNQWTGIISTSPSLQTGGTRGIHFGGVTPSAINNIDFFNVDTTGDAADFGDMTRNTNISSAGTASRTRGIAFGGGNTPDNIIEFITISSTGNATDFGDMIQHRRNAGAGSNGVRGVVIGGWTAPAASPGYHNLIDYITIAQTGNAFDFGDMISNGESQFAVANSPTRIVYGQYGTPSGASNVIEYITTSTLGNASNFGDVTGDTRSSGAGGGNAVRGIFGGGQAPNQPTYTPQDEIHFLTISTLGNTTDFGDLTEGKSNLNGCSSPTRMTFNGGYTPSITSKIDYVQIASIGNALDFGDLTANKTRGGACSNGHGGL
tara:strand:+ start:892 stop:1926 length:1035 start_codon:yes stop_codon:yes gene_type:complete